MKRNDSKPVPQEVLYDVVLAAIDGRKVRAAVFTTFEFDPEFFELHVLPCVCGERAWSNMPNVQRMQLADELRALGTAVAVYYDRHAIVGNQGCTLDYQHVGLSREHGVFHAKSILILVDGPEPEDGQSLLLVTTSANLTRNGWWENVEVGQIVEVGQERSSVRDDLLGGKGLLSTLRNMALEAQETEALRRIHGFLVRETEQTGHLKKEGILKPRFYSGQVMLPQFLQDAGRIEPGMHLEIVSPFFDHGDDPSALRRLLEVLQPVQTRVFLPSDREGQAACSRAFFDAVRQLPDVHWATLPSSVTAWGRRHEAAGDRPVHAKVYRLFSQGRYARDVRFVGSANLTDAAHSAGKERNIETGILVELDCQDEPDWLLKPLRVMPTEFQPQPPEGTVGLEACHPVTLQFDWQTRTLSYYWQDESGLPSWAKIVSQGVELFTIAGIHPDSWREAWEPAATAMGDRLKSSALVELIDDQGRSQLLLVQEMGMAYKPSMLDQLTPSEILEYWLLLTPRQRDIFLEAKIRELLARKGGPPNTKTAEPGSSLFDQFAGIFHAFSCLEERVRGALLVGNHGEAEYRLLGCQYDSLPALVEKVSQPERVQEDPVIAYVTLLCAVGTMDAIRDSRRQGESDGDTEAFLDQPLVRLEIKKLESQWRQSLQQARSAIHLGGATAGEQFLDWYEKAFFRPVRLPQPATEGLGMIALRKISMAAASRFMDFAAGSKVAQSVAPLQMKGAVGAHNILADRKAVYLGDEVGMGKTYVALGTLALIRHFHPSLRVLYIVPKENLQSKWIKEIHNFASQKWNFTDSRVKAIQGRAVAEPAKCESLLDLVEKAALEANRDFILRLSSFSFGLRNEVQTWRQKARELRRAFPGLAEAALEVDGRSTDKEGFKDQFACAVNAVLPHFDLLVLDEGHNLKHGYRDGQGSTRNRLLAMVLGTKAPPPGLPPTERRIDRAILLSATPVDRDYKDLWNQLDLLGLAEGMDDLANEELDDDRRKAIARKFMIRRVGSIQIAGRPHTRNMYRREWRGGGVSQHDDPLKVPDGRQRLVVALMQKKVADLMAAQGRQSGKRFSRSFQIGMLASFESFSRTAKVQGVDANFDQAEQTEDQTERQGIDTRTINDIASGYRQLFGESLPHPKMDAVVQEAWQRLREAKKTLIFVRRVHSVPEMVEKLTKLYDQWLYDRIRGDIKTVSDSAEMLGRAWEKYQPERIQFYEDAGAAFAANASRTQDDEPDEQDGPAPPSASRAIRDAARPESFFSWFFRGDGPSGILSGAKFVQNRLTNESASLSTFFEDNWVLWLLGWPQRVLDRLAEVTGRTPETVRRSLQNRVSQIYSDKKAIKLRLYRAYQTAALELLAGVEYPGAKAAHIALDFLPSRPDGGVRGREIQTDPEAFLGTRTFFTELAARPELCGLLWPAQADSGSVEAVRRRERMRLMLSSAIRLGHPIVDLWLSYVKLTGSLAATRQESAEADADQGADTDISIRLAKAFLDELDRQRLGQGQGCDGCFSWRELLEIGRNFDLISNVNFHDLAGKNLGELARSLGDKLGQQQPIIGMHGGVNKRAVSQFRMPGYPYVLIATDVLQEGEDLHTFCDRITHYGISWTPSAMEQRTGRIDRIGSLTHRKLEGTQQLDETDKLQVYFPYLGETWEYIQVTEIFRRLNRFMEMLHELKNIPGDRDSQVDVSKDIFQSSTGVPEVVRGLLKSDFDVSSECLEGEDLLPESDGSERTKQHFAELVKQLGERILIEEPQPLDTTFRGMVSVEHGRLLTPQDGAVAVRKQRFTLELRGTHGGRVLLRCRSLIGSFSVDEVDRLNQLLWFQQDHPEAKVCALPEDDTGKTMSVELFGEMLFSPQTAQREELTSLVTTVTTLADQAEEDIRGVDDLSAGAQTPPGVEEA